MEQDRRLLDLTRAEFMFYFRAAQKKISVSKKDEAAIISFSS